MMMGCNKITRSSIGVGTASACPYTGFTGFSVCLWYQVPWSTYAFRLAFAVATAIALLTTLLIDQRIAAALWTEIAGDIQHVHAERRAAFAFVDAVVL
jgi:hypothetical protein